MFKMKARPASPNCSAALSRRRKSSDKYLQSFALVALLIDQQGYNIFW
jgi:hypothetical protein